MEYPTLILPFYWISADKECKVEVVPVPEAGDDCLLLLQGVVLILELGQLSLVNLWPLYKFLLIEVDVHKVLSPGGGTVLGCSADCNLF